MDSRSAACRESPGDVDVIGWQPGAMPLVDLSVGSFQLGP
jgi:hypothetical protein